MIKKVEIGIYDWAKYDTLVAARLVDIEEQRIHCVAKLYQKKGHSRATSYRSSETCLFNICRVDDEV